MASITEASAHIFLTTPRFQELIAQGVITKAERGKYDLDKVREEYIRNVRKRASGRGDNDGLTEARAELAREQATSVAMKNAVARGEFAPVAMILKGVETVCATFRERCLAIPGKLALSCEMRSRGEVEELIRAEIYEALDELSRPIVTADDLGGSDDSGSTGESVLGGETAAAIEPD